MLKDCKVAHNKYHKWLYDHNVYISQIYFSSDCVTVHRHCSLCGKHEIAVAKERQKSPEGLIFPDIILGLNGEKVYPITKKQ